MWYGEYEKCILSYREEKETKTGNPRHMWEDNVKSNLKIFWEMRWSHVALRKVHCRGRGLCKYDAVPSDNFLTS